MRPLNVILLSILFFSSCDNESVNAKSSAEELLTAGTWYFWSINGGEAYDCVKQTNLIFHPNGILDLNTFVRMPDYTCGGPYPTQAQWTLKNDGKMVSWNGEDFTIEKLTEKEFIKSLVSEGTKYTWVYKR
jgi:hypothetical protein